MSLRSVYKNEPLANFCELGSTPASSSPWQSEMELPLTFKDSSVEVIIELLPAVYSQEIGKWHMGPGTKQNRRYSLARRREGGAEGKVNDHSRILVGESLLEVERVGEGEGRIECFFQRLTFKQTLVKLDATSAPATERHTRTL